MSLLFFKDFLGYLEECVVLQIEVHIMLIT